MTNFQKCLEVLYEEYSNRELILIKKTDRYDVGDKQWKDMLNMSYVQEYSIIEGTEKELVIKKKVDSTVEHWEEQIEEYSNKLKRSLESASKYININENLLKELI